MGYAVGAFLYFGLVWMEQDRSGTPRWWAQNVVLVPIILPAVPIWLVLQAVLYPLVFVVRYGTVPLRRALWKDTVSLYPGENVWPRRRISTNDAHWLIQRLEADGGTVATRLAADLAAVCSLKPAYEREEYITTVEQRQALLRVLDDPPTKPLRKLRKTVLRALRKS